MPITFGNPDFQQRSIADRATQLADGKPNTGNWDMITVNETGPHKGRFLFTVFETGQSGVQRHDLLDRQDRHHLGQPVPGGHVAFDACYWTPWGTLITAEESWDTAAGGSTSPYGRLFEFVNPLDRAGHLEPLTPTSNDGAEFVHRNVVPRVSHEGIQFDKAGNMYFIDELNGGCLYKYTPAAKMAHVMARQGRLLRRGADVRAAGRGRQHAECHGRLHLGSVHGCEWRGAARRADHHRRQRRHLGRRPQHHGPAAVQGHRLSAPEDMQIQTIGDREYLYVTTTTTHEITAWT